MNSITTRPQKAKFSVAITTKVYRELIKNTLGDPVRAQEFVASISSAVAVNPALQDCDAGTILAGGLLGETLGLSPSPQLGYFYLVPFDCKVKNENGKTIYLTDEQGRKRLDPRGKWIPLSDKKAQFILGYKGYIQLAVRTGKYRRINVIEIKEGEIQHFDPLNEEIECLLIDDFDKRDAAPTAGYYAMFETLEGFRKAIYWSRQKMESHADRYSPAFSSEAYHRLLNNEIPTDELWKYSSFWYKEFDAMAKKTMLRQLISKWGYMTHRMADAMEKDNQMIALNHGDFEALPPVELGTPDDGPDEPDTPDAAAPPVPDTEPPKVDIHAL